MKFYTALQARLNSLRTEDDGATAVEYGLMVALIAVVIIFAVTALGGTLNDIFTGVEEDIRPVAG